MTASVQASKVFEVAEERPTGSWNYPIKHRKARISGFEHAEGSEDEAGSEMTERPGGHTRSERKPDIARVNHVAGQGFCAEVLPKDLDRFRLQLCITNA